MQIPQLVNQQIERIASTPNWFKNSFPAQRAFINDPARLKAARCTRRAGKSYAAGLLLLKAAYETPRASVLYIALTRDSAKRIMWDNILKEISREMKLDADFKETEQIVTLPNESKIYLLGADTKPDEMNKILGQKFHEVVVDEASKYHIDVRKMVYDVLKSTTIDSLGRISMIGTTDDFVRSFFAAVTLGKEPGWSLHRWTSTDNPHVAANVQADIAELEKADPDVRSKSWFRQNYMAEWEVNADNLIYRFSPDEVIVDRLPLLVNPSYTLAAVIAYRGSSAFAVLAEGDNYREAFVVEAYRLQQTDLYAVLDECAQLQERYPITSVVCVDTSDRLATEIRRRYPISVENHGSKDRPALIQLFTAELARNNIKVLRENTDILDEWGTVVRDDRAPKGVIREHPANPNQVATAVLFAWSKCSNYNYSPVTASDDPYDSHWDAVIARIQEDIDDPDFQGY